MKKEHSNELKAGIFLVLASLLLVILFLKVSGTLELLNKETFTIKVRFTNVMGVSNQSNTKWIKNWSGYSLSIRGR